MSFRPRGQILASLAVLAIAGTGADTPGAFEPAPEPRLDDAQHHRRSRRRGRKRGTNHRKPNRAKGRMPKKTRWTRLERTTPSGKQLFRCSDCGRESPTPDKRCPKGCRER